MSGTNQRPPGLKRFLVRTNCEYTVEVEAGSEKEALEKADHLAFEPHWTQAWAENTVEEA